MQIGTLSYALSAIAFAVLSILLVVSWRGRAPGALLTSAAAVSAIWAGLAAYQIAAGRASLMIVDLLEILRDALWLSFLITVMARAGIEYRLLGQSLRKAALAVVAFCVLLMGMTLLRAADFSGTFANLGLVTDILGRLILALAGVVIIHQLYLNVSPEQRWSIKFLCLGTGGLFVYDFYLYSDAMLFRHVDLALWDARGIANAIVVPLIAVSAARNRDWSLDVSVSRRAVFHSAALVGAGIYLLGMAAAGYYIRFFGGQWGSVFQVTFLSGAVILLLIVLFSGAARSHLKVFLSKHFFSYRYDYREEWLRFTRALSEGERGVQLRERSIRAIADLVESPAGALWLQHESGSFELGGHWNLPNAVGAIEAESPFERFLEQREWVINLDEYRAQPERYGGLEIPGFLLENARAWLVVPLILQEQLIGFVVLAHPRGGVTLNWEVSDLLKTAGRQAASNLAHLEAAKALMDAKQFESFNRMSAFVMHDLKNLVSQLSLLMSNAERHKQNPAFQQEMLETIGNSIDKMKRLLTQLKSGSAIQDLPATLSIEHAVMQAIALQVGLPIVPKLVIDGEAPQVIASRDRLTRVIGHLIRNAIEATPADGSVTVRLAGHDRFAVITVADTGLGMSEQFLRDKLFRPFESTKQTGIGVGIYECKQYVEELGGRIEVESVATKGSTFRVWLPGVERLRDSEIA